MFSAGKNVQDIVAPFMMKDPGMFRSMLGCLLVWVALAGCGGSAVSGSAAVSVDGGVTLSLAQSSAARNPASSIAASSLAAAAAANNAFAVGLYSQWLSMAPPGNVLTSPLSASLALTMTYAGAEGQTATEMANALQFGDAGAAIFDGQNALSQALVERGASAFATAEHNAAVTPEGVAPSPSDYELQIVNSVWGQVTYAWEASFLDILAKSYGSGVYLEDFVHEPDQARQTINTWVSSETADKINNLLPMGSIDSSTRLVLVNAIHLKLPWQNTFDASETAPGTFTRADGSTVSASFMNDAQTWPYVDDGRAQIVALPLSGGQVSVVVALPHADLATYEAGLTTGSAALTVPTTGAYVELSLPKVTFTSPTFSLKAALQAMGMVQAFDPAAANFSGMCAHPPDGSHLYVADVLQKATIAMQETGVEAAAATAVLVDTAAISLPPDPTTMVVNRPYLIALVDQPTGAILFLGHVDDPTATGSP
ncbi:MAG: serpin family protein [Polyangiaceae bacterium]|jgi:serpin B